MELVNIYLFAEGYYSGSTYVDNILSTNKPIHIIK